MEINVYTLTSARRIEARNLISFNNRESYETLFEDPLWCNCSSLLPPALEMLMMIMKALAPSSVSEEQTYTILRWGFLEDDDDVGGKALLCDFDWLLFIQTTPSVYVYKRTLHLSHIRPWQPFKMNGVSMYILSSSSPQDLLYFADGGHLIFSSSAKGGKLYPIWKATAKD